MVESSIGEEIKSILADLKEETLIELGLKKNKDHGKNVDTISEIGKFKL